MLLWIGLTLTSMVGIHGWDERESKSLLSQMSLIIQRQREAGHILAEFERYRRQSALFRKMTPDEIAQTKDHLKSEVTREVTLMQKLDATPEEQELGAKILERTTDLMILGSKIEQRNPLIKDLYQNQEIRDLHDTILTNLNQVQTLIEARSTHLQEQKNSRAKRNLKILIFLAAQGFLGIGILLIKQYLSNSRPLSILYKRMLSFKRGEIPPPSSKLTGIHQELDTSLAELSSLVESQRKERHQFLIAISQDLRGPLLNLQAGVLRFLGGESSASEILTRSALRVSKTLDALTDLMDIDRKNLRLNEELIDLNELIQRTITSLGGHDSLHPVKAHLPKTAVWALIDPKRLESVLINLISKIIQQFPQGCSISISLRKRSENDQQGLELLIQESTLSTDQRTPSGPRLDVLQHWISETGFGMALAQKILKAHGGSLQVAGLSGVGLEFSLFIPQERIASLHSASRTGFSRQFEPQRIETMLAEKSINFSS